MTLAELATLAATHGVTIRASVVPRGRLATSPASRGAIRYRIAGGRADGRATTARDMARALHASWLATDATADVYLPHRPKGI